MSALPALFVGHGSPMIMLEPSPARELLRELGERFGRPAAIVVVSAHHDTAEAVVTAVDHPATIHDFGGFPPELHAIQYPAKGDPALAAEIAGLLAEAGVPVGLDPARGLDHGAWVPLMLGWPEADVPVVQLSISSRHPPEWHYRIGGLLRGLRERGVLIVGSGSLTHNLRAIFAEGRGHDAPVDPKAAAFAEWMHSRLTAGDTPAALDALAQAPEGRWNHPTPDHILPLFAAMGAGGTPLRAERLHHSFTYGVLAMDAYAFN
jgi:4,5-DOPA dioxygenase extradiol